MSATKSGAAVIASQTSAAGSSYATPSAGCQSASQNISTAYGALWTVRMTPGASVTTGCTAQVDISYDGATWRSLNQVLSGVTSGANYDFCIEVPAEALDSRITFFGNAGGSVTVSAELSQLTGI